MISFRALEADVSRIEPRFTKLHIDEPEVDPDDSFSHVPYDKGAFFLETLESRVGGPEKFEPFLKRYFEEFGLGNVSHDDFKNFFVNHFPSCDIHDWDIWMFGIGCANICILKLF